MVNVKPGQFWKYEDDRLFQIAKIIDKEKVFMQEFKGEIEGLFEYFTRNLNSLDWKLVENKINYKLWKI